MQDEGWGPRAAWDPATPLWLRHGAVIELPRADRTGSCHYRNLASLAGLLYAEAGSALESIVQQVAKLLHWGLPPPRQHACDVRFALAA